VFLQKRRRERELGRVEKSTGESDSSDEKWQ